MDLVHQPRAAKGPPFPSIILSCLLVLFPGTIIGSLPDPGNYYITEWQTTPSDHNPPFSSYPGDTSLLPAHYTRSPRNDLSIHSYNTRGYAKWSDRMSNTNTNRDEFVWKGASPRKVDVNYRGGRSAPTSDQKILHPVSVQRSHTHDTDYSWREWTAPNQQTNSNWLDKSVAIKNDNNWGTWASKNTEQVSKWNQRSWDPKFQSTFNGRSQLLRGNRWRRSSMEDLSSREMLTSDKASTTTSTPPQYEQTRHEQFGWSQQKTAPQDSSGESFDGWSSTSGGPKHESGWSGNVQNGWAPHSSAPSAGDYNSPVSSLPSSQPYKDWENVPQSNNYNKHPTSDYSYDDNYSSPLPTATESPYTSYSKYHSGVGYKSSAKGSKLKNYKKSYRPTVTYPRYSNYGHILHEDPLPDPPAVYNYDKPGKTPITYEAEHVTQRPRMKNSKNPYSYYSYNGNSVKSTTAVPMSSPPSVPYSSYVGYDSGSNEYVNQQHHYNSHISNEVENTWGAPPSPSQLTTSQWTTPEKNIVRETATALMPASPIYEELARPPVTAQVAGTGWSTPSAETRHKVSWTNKKPISKKKPLVKEYFGKVVDNFNTLCSAVFPLLGNLGRGRFCIRKDSHGYHLVDYNGQGWSYK